MTPKRRLFGGDGGKAPAELEREAAADLNKVMRAAPPVARRPPSHASPLEPSLSESSVASLPFSNFLSAEDEAEASTELALLQLAERSGVSPEQVAFRQNPGEAAAIRDRELAKYVDKKRAVTRDRRADRRPAEVPGPATRPATTRPATTRPATTRPATTRPATTRPATTRPASTRLAQDTGSARDTGPARDTGSARDTGPGKNVGAGNAEEAPGPAAGRAGTPKRGVPPKTRAWGKPW